MKARAASLLLITVALIGAGIYGAYRLGMSRGMHAPPAAGASGREAAAKGGEGTKAGDKKVLYWYDPMYPQQRFDKPGKSPFMDMQLVPRYADEGSGEGGVLISPRTVQNLGIRTAEARAGSLDARLTAVGTVEYNERSLVVVQPRAGGFIEKLHVRATLDAVRAGDPLVDILVPDWVAVQEEYLLLRNRTDSSVRELIGAARQRLVLAGMSEEQIAALERDGKVRNRITLRAPVAGVIAELGAREGMTVTAGATLFRIAGLATVWVVAQVPEAQAGWLVPGSKAEIRVPAYTETFAGQVGAILPEVNAATRTLRARIEVQNPGARLKPGMYATVGFIGQKRESLLVPAEAVIRTGERNVVIVAEGEGKFRPVVVEVGTESGADAEIRKGLKPGDKVVVSGQFLIDSEASLRGTLARVESAGEKPADTRNPATHRGRGKVTSVDAAKGRVELEHEPIPAMKWPAMSMGFTVPDIKQLESVRKGDQVEFEVRGKPGEGGDYVIEKIAPEGKAP
jgi:Cu(I)/Ag(I) efflux system membrane fusion protein